MDKLEWCMRQKRGIRITKPSAVIAKDYFRKADEAILMMVHAPGVEWKTIGGYYACYYAIYAFLQRAGVKSEIHECTIASMPLFGFDDSDVRFLEDLKQERINAQYYIDRKYGAPQGDAVKRFVLNCRARYGRTDFEAIARRLKLHVKGPRP
ncbi:MAG: hypothetical protein QGG50_07475 [Methanopyri archaeon]|jgi:hypothetical protein|nr:hypothetical protein [Methanopyri archaeon]|tara:strand:- start:284 stop:739 length:456 start_codon:yes stop_codon:yes gene_type:complete